jgi:protein SCO1/2
MAQNPSAAGKKWILALLLVVPVTVYLLSVLLSGAVQFRSLEKVGPGPDTAFSFLDQRGRTITQDSLRGKIVVVSFFFTSCPTVCPAMNLNLKQVHDRLMAYKDIQFVSISVDPETDRPEVLMEYAERFGVEKSKSWWFLTGNRDLTYRLANLYYLVAQPDAGAEGGFTHSQTAVLLDWEGNIRSRLEEDTEQIKGVYDLTSPHQADELVDDLRVLAKEYRSVKMGR